MQKQVIGRTSDAGVRRELRWGVILAGGDGTRLRPLTRSIAGDDRPKQFCAVIGDETLLSQTQHRISRLIPRPRTLLVLTQTHEPFYKDLVSGLPSSRLLIQPCNRGTAPAILYSLLHIRNRESDGVVAFFPSDHYFADDAAFIAHIDSAYTAAALRPEKLILLGIPADTPQVDYGWIQPGESLDGPVLDYVFTVARFWEKPTLVLASALMEDGALWNSFVMVGHISVFLELIRNALPGLIESFESIRSSSSTEFERTALCELYSGIPVSGFCQEVLSVQPDLLAVLRADGLGWSDLGEPGRVLSVLERKGVRTEWGLDTDPRDGQDAGPRRSLIQRRPRKIYKI
jgi:mannose-1-phosphate guanylyltransferase